MTTRPLLSISRGAEADWITALEFGRVDDGLPLDRWEPVNCWFAWILDQNGRRVGVHLNDASKAELDDEAFADLWDPTGPTFDAPSLGFVGVPAGAVLAATLTRLQGRSSLNRFYFNAAVAAEDPDEALTLWSLCLETGDLMAHYGLGYSHCAAGNHAAAYHHLSYYATLATHDPWTWCWLGRSALAVGENERGVMALKRARALETLGGGEGETDAAELLAGLE